MINLCLRQARVYRDRHRQTLEELNVPCLVMASVSDKNVREIIKLAIQLTQVAVPVPVLRAHSGYISELTVHGIGPIPAANYLSVSCDRSLIQTTVQTTAKLTTAIHLIHTPKMVTIGTFMKR